jgi:hypothetical protein
MSEKKKQPTDNPGHRWQEGHPRYGGRKKRTAQMARALAEEMGVDPLEFMLSIIKSDVMDQTVIENGKQKRVKVAVPIEVRMDAAKTVANYMYPRLSSAAVTGADDGPVEFSSVLDVSAILANPQLAAAAQELALMVVEQESLAEGRSEPRLIDQPDYR